MDNDQEARRSLEDKWREYLERRGHRILRRGHKPGLIRSSNDKRTHYRWLLLVGEHRTRTLNASEQTEIRRNLSRAKSKKEAVYLVVGFMRAPRRLIIMSARAALKIRRIRADKGGIAWED